MVQALTKEVRYLIPAYTDIQAWKISKLNPPFFLLSTEKLFIFNYVQTL